MPFIAPVDLPNYHKSSYNTPKNISAWYKNFPFSINSDMRAPHQLGPPPKWHPPSVTPLTLIFIFTIFAKIHLKQLTLDNIINFGPPFLLLWPPIKKFLVFALDYARPCLDWQPRAILTSQPIYDPFKYDFEWRPKCKIGLNVNLPKNRQAEKNLKCTPECSNVSSTNHQLTLNPYHRPFMV